MSLTADNLAYWSALQANVESSHLLSELLYRPMWHARAACRGMGSDIFFPGRGDRTDPAKAICAGCPVRRECHEDGARPVCGLPSSGVWAGLSQQERLVARARFGRSDWLDLDADTG